MSSQVSEIDIPNAVINLAYQLHKTQLVLEWIVNNNSGIQPPPPEVMSRIDDESVENLQNKYPSAGILKQ